MSGYSVSRSALEISHVSTLVDGSQPSTTPLIDKIPGQPVANQALQATSRVSDYDQPSSVAEQVRTTSVLMSLSRDSRRRRRRRRRRPQQIQSGSSKSSVPTLATITESYSSSKENLPLNTATQETSNQRFSSGKEKDFLPRSSSESAASGKRSITLNLPPSLDQDLIKLEALHDQFRIQNGCYPKLLRLRRLMKAISEAESYPLTPAAIKAYSAVANIIRASYKFGEKNSDDTETDNSDDEIENYEDYEEDDEEIRPCDEEVALSAQFARVLSRATLDINPLHKSEDDSINDDEANNSHQSVFREDAAQDVESGATRTYTADTIIKETKLEFFSTLQSNPEFDDGTAYEMPLTKRAHHNTRHLKSSFCVYCDTIKKKRTATAKTIRQRVDSAFLLDETIKSSTLHRHRPRRGIEISDRDISIRVRDEFRLMEAEGYRFSKRIANIDDCEQAVFKLYSKHEATFLMSDLKAKFLWLLSTLKQQLTQHHSRGRNAYSTVR
ncbi:uncharacterized protein V2V93DRAFT_364498 [Kockiozyma suomiensis]|uniref:uncharacterized protein n=1 Tax=Kockiozyma suomiensis TaxID=1337062 RepID=UPI003344090D